jgi:CheY-like chemotaxis protein
VLFLGNKDDTTLNNFRLLIGVDLFLMVAEAMVNKYGLPVMKAHDGLEVISIFEKHADDICCIILDIQMPKMNGIDTLRYVRKMDEDIPVIIVSGYLLDANHNQLDSLCPTGYLQKPISYNDLADMLKKCLA